MKQEVNLTMPKEKNISDVEKTFRNASKSCRGLQTEGYDKEAHKAALLHAHHKFMANYYRKKHHKK